MDENPYQSPPSETPLSPPAEPLQPWDWLIVGAMVLLVAGLLAAAIKDGFNFR